MIDMYIKCGFLEFGRKVFYEMPKRDVISWTELISVYAKNGNMESAGELFDGLPGKGCRSLELQAPGGRTEVEAGNAGSILTKAPPPVLPNNMSPSMMANVPSLIEEEQSKKSLLKWKGQKKLNRIYADWLDDLPLVHTLTNQVHS
ncbi:hypothetical protein DKX38_022490 [Salix brachista]|uniref:Pentatricopeptide repeat-containing protein n=1 Tax=Salix brachista TaxID=2182728 RepID=A0A5N5JZM8_9ROSI|nr:hypothetical protein DKX38_022490 [Salix brachista]